jgi:hypothetical protein
MGRILLSLLLSLVPWVLSAAPVAALASLEGEVSVLRGGVLIPSEKVGEAFLLEAFDTVTTGATGRADIRLASATGLTGLVRLDPETSLYLDLTSLRNEQTAGVELLTGAVTVSLSGLVGASAVEVRTEVGTFGGAGPSFRVVLDPAGDVLVTASAGKVLCRVDNRTVSIEPGSVAEALTLDRVVRTYPVNASTLDSYEASWVRQRRQIFRDQAPVFFRVLASRYQLQGGLFLRAWDRNSREVGDNALGAPGAVANLRRASFPLERSMFRVQALRKLLDEGVLDPSLEVNRGYTAKDFFRQAGQEREPWSNRLGEARALYRVQADRHGGEFPKATEVQEITSDSAFFH